MSNASITESYICGKRPKRHGSWAWIIKNILGQVLALTDGAADGITRLIEKVGFILPISFQNYEAIELKALTKIIRRIKVTVKLMNAIDGKDVYEQIRMFQAMTYNDVTQPT